MTLIWIEDVRKTIDARAKITAAFAGAACSNPYARTVPAEPLRNQPVDDLATIIFSSGSTGEPKGIKLSHFSLDSNVEGIAQVLHIDKHDRVLGILPFFHSFGYLATLWFPTIHGAGVVYHPSPLDAGAIGDLIHHHKVNRSFNYPYLFADCISAAVRRNSSDPLRIVLTGAEKLI